jgi:hypothetical protein
MSQANDRKERAMRHKAILSQPEEAPSGTTVHIVDVTIAGDSVQVSPDYVRIHEGESVQWRFHGVQGLARPEIRFINPADKQCGPFKELFPNCCRDTANGARVYTLTGPSADTRPCWYEYEAGVTVEVAGRLKWVGVDPVIDNDGKPPG